MVIKRYFVAILNIFKKRFNLKLTLFLLSGNQVYTSIFIAVASLCKVLVDQSS